MLYARYTKIKEVRSPAENVLLLDGGDQFQGTLWFHVYRGLASAQFMRRLGYDAMVCGICYDYYSLWTLNINMMKLETI